MDFKTLDAKVLKAQYREEKKQDLLNVKTLMKEVFAEVKPKFNAIAETARISEMTNGQKLVCRIDPSTMSPAQPEATTESFYRLFETDPDALVNTVALHFEGNFPYNLRIRLDSKLKEMSFWLFVPELQDGKKKTVPYVTII